MVASVQIFDTSKESSNHGIKVLIYSRSGVGKTWLARTAPAPIIISAENGTLSLSDVQLPMIKVKTVEDLKNIYSWLTESMEAKKFQTVYVDSLSEIAETVLANAKIVNKDQRQVYGAFFDSMIPLIKSFRDVSGKHVVMTAKEDVIKDELSGVTLRGPMMPGNKLSPQLPYLFDQVFHLGIGKTTDGKSYRFLQTEPDLQYDAKSRGGKLDPIERPDLTFIFNKILGVR
jgi:hypothetical protein